MKNTLQEIIMVTERGNYSFKNKHNTVDPIKAINSFESCNWNTLGCISYQVKMNTGSGNTTTEEFKGVNADRLMEAYINHPIKN